MVEETKNPYTTIRIDRVTHDKLKFIAKEKLNQKPSDFLKELIDCLFDVLYSYDGQVRIQYAESLYGLLIKPFGTKLVAKCTDINTFNEELSEHGLNGDKT